jgi:hypothetical protein
LSGFAFQLQHFAGELQQRNLRIGPRQIDHHLLFVQVEPPPDELRTAIGQLLGVQTP